MTDLIAELAEVVRQLDRWWYAPKLAHDFIRTHHAEFARILADDAAIRAAHTELVIRLGEVTEKLEAAKNDVFKWQGIAELSHGEMAEQMEKAKRCNPCVWTEDEWDGSWDTACGNKHQFTDGSPADNEHAFCPYCGGKLEVGDADMHNSAREDGE